MNRIALASTVAAALLCTSVPAHAQASLAWDEDPSAILLVNGYAVTIDGVRTDYGLSPTGLASSCGCSIVLPFSGGYHTIIVSAYNLLGEAQSAPFAVGPVASAGGPYAGVAGASIQADASRSVAPTGSIVGYSWSWGDGAHSSGVTASHTYASSGTFTVTLTITDNAGATASASTVANISGTTSNPTPPPAGGSTAGAYNGTPASVPGTIEAENFDNGGQGVAYSDSDAGNLGGAYRSTDVDIEGTTDDGGGYDVGWIAAGEWLKYTINVTTAGTYNLDVRVASLGTGGTFHIEVDGVDRTGPLTIPNTGAWQNWQTLSAPSISFPTTGSHVMRVVFDSSGPSGAVGNLNWIRTTAPVSSSASAFGGIPASIPGRVEAENFDQGGEGVGYFDQDAGNNGGQYRATDVDIEVTTDVDGGYDVGWLEPGEWLAYTVNVTAAGNYDIALRVASPWHGGTLSVEVNGVDRTGPLAIPDTDGWQSWQTIATNLGWLDGGIQTLRVVVDGHAPHDNVGNLNYIELTKR